MTRSGARGSASAIRQPTSEIDNAASRKAATRPRAGVGGTTRCMIVPTRIASRWRAIMASGNVHGSRW